MDQRVTTRLLQKHQDSSSNPQNSCEKLGWLWLQSWRLPERQDPWIHWPTSFTELVSFWVSERPCIQTWGRNTEGHQASTSGLHVCTHRHTHPNPLSVPQQEDKGRVRKSYVTHMCFGFYVYLVLKCDLEIFPENISLKYTMAIQWLVHCIV